MNNPFCTDEKIELICFNSHSLSKVELGFKPRKLESIKL